MSIAEEVGMAANVEGVQEIASEGSESADATSRGAGSEGNTSLEEAVVTDAVAGGTDAEMQSAGADEMECVERCNGDDDGCNNDAATREGKNHSTDFDSDGDDDDNDAEDDAETDVNALLNCPTFANNDSSDYPSLLRQKAYDTETSLRCGICHDFYKIPVSLQPCRHAFCSECIRRCLRTGLKSMKRTANCPTCRGEVHSNYERSLMPNRSLERCVAFYKTTTRPDLQKKQKKLLRLCHRGAIGSAKSKHLQDSITGILDQTNKAISRALRETNHGVTASRGCLPTPHYHGMKRKKLVELLNAHGLPINGSDRELRERHAEFIMLYNAECDSDHPKSTSQIVQELVNREQAKRDEEMSTSEGGRNSHAACMYRLKRSREEVGEEEKKRSRREAQESSSSSSSSTISSGDSEFDHQLKANFQALIREARERGNIGKGCYPEERDRLRQVWSQRMEKMVGPEDRTYTTVGEINTRLPPSWLESVDSGGLYPLDADATNARTISQSQGSVCVTRGDRTQHPVHAMEKQTKTTVQNPYKKTVKSLDQSSFLKADRSLARQEVVCSEAFITNAAKSEQARFVTPPVASYSDVASSTHSKHRATASTTRSASVRSKMNGSDTAAIGAGKGGGESSKMVASKVHRQETGKTTLAFDGGSDRLIGSSTPRKLTRIRRRTLGSTGPWQCSACTFYNRVRVWRDAKCQICETPRQVPAQSLPVSSAKTTVDVVDC